MNEEKFKILLDLNIKTQYKLEILQQKYEDLLKDKENMRVLISYFKEKYDDLLKDNIRDKNGK